VFEHHEETHAALAASSAQFQDWQGMRLYCQVSHGKLEGQLKQTGWTCVWLVGDVSVSALARNGGDACVSALRKAIAEAGREGANALEVLEARETHVLGMTLLRLKARKHRLQRGIYTPVRLEPLYFTREA